MSLLRASIIPNRNTLIEVADYILHGNGMSLHGASIIPNRNTLIEVSSYIWKVSDNIRNW